jgi:catechol 2,3-dioxygenase-like lactoylglutathione lyase family enzyme
MPITLENVGIAVRDLQATIAFFTDLGLTVLGRETTPTQPNEIGIHRVAFSVDSIDEALEIAARHGCHPLRGVATYAGRLQAHLRPRAQRPHPHARRGPGWDMIAQPGARRRVGPIVRGWPCNWKR